MDNKTRKPFDTPPNTYITFCKKNRPQLITQPLLFGSRKVYSKWMVPTFERTLSSSSFGTKLTSITKPGDSGGRVVCMASPVMLSNLKHEKQKCKFYVNDDNFVCNFQENWKISGQSLKIHPVNFQLKFQTPYCFVPNLRPLMNTPSGYSILQYLDIKMRTHADDRMK